MEFEETLEVFYFFNIIHCKVAAILVAGFGLLSIAGFFGAGVAFFEWWRHETAIDVIALIGFSIFFIGGCVAHGTLLYALQHTRARLVVPFIVFHCFMIAVNSITALIAVGEIVSDQSSEVDDSDRVARIVLIALPLASAVEVLMLIVVFRARWYLRLRARYLRNGRPPRVHHTAVFSLASVLGRNKRAEESSSTPGGAPVPAGGNRVAPAEALALGAIAPEVASPPPPSEESGAPDGAESAPSVPRRKVVAIRVPTPPALQGNVFPLGRLPPPEVAETGPL